MRYSSAIREDPTRLTDYDHVNAARPPQPMSLREQLLWTLFALGLLICFLALLVEDQLA